MEFGKLAFLSVFILLLNLCQANANAETKEASGKFAENSAQLNLESIRQLSSDIRTETGCSPNTCFSIDGSSSIPPEGYQLQVDFARLSTAVLSKDPKAGFAFVQYGRELEIIQRLSNGPVDFDRFKQSTFLRAPATFIEPGLLWCSKELGKVEGEPSIIILTADARSPVFDRDFAAQAAAQFKAASPSNEIVGVGVGYEDPAVITEIVGGEHRVFDVFEINAVLDFIDEFLSKVCPKAPSPTPLSCPCRCISARGSGSKAKRKALRKAKKSCKKFKGVCKVERCRETRKVAFKCC